MSSLYTTEEGATAEMYLVGNDGVASVSPILGYETASNTSVVVVAGEAYRMKARTLRAGVRGSAPLQSLLLRYTQALIMQISQTAVCNRLHGAEQRLCRWLLMCHDRVQSNDLQMTQEFISNMLGGRRETVTVAAGRLQDAGLIRYSRGHITNLDRQRLEETGCECYLRVEAERERDGWPEAKHEAPPRFDLLGAGLHGSWSRVLRTRFYTGSVRARSSFNCAESRRARNARR